ncbi:MAG: copper transporter [Clostridia bacterium]|nr:copper transporter [Clostridia bacterium]MDD4047837.1 copper transporter [Clostridia bacterium]
MIIDFKYHITSLVAIFMALGLGIFIGSSMVGEGLIDNIMIERDNIIKRLESDYNVLKQEIDDQKKLNNYNTRYIEESLPYIIGDKLKEKKINIIIDTPFDNENQQQFINSLEIAGAMVTYSPSIQEVYCGFEKSMIDVQKKADIIIVLGENEINDDIVTQLNNKGIQVYIFNTKKNSDSLKNVPRQVSVILNIAKNCTPEYILNNIDFLPTLD